MMSSQNGVYNKMSWFVTELIKMLEPCPHVNHHLEVYEQHDAEHPLDLMLRDSSEWSNARWDVDSNRNRNKKNPVMLSIRKV